MTRKARRREAKLARSTVIEQPLSQKHRPSGDLTQPPNKKLKFNEDHVNTTTNVHQSSPELDHDEFARHNPRSPINDDRECIIAPEEALNNDCSPMQVTINSPSTAMPTPRTIISIYNAGFGNQTSTREAQIKFEQMSPCIGAIPAASKQPTSTTSTLNGRSISGKGNNKKKKNKKKRKRASQKQTPFIRNNTFVRGDKSCVHGRIACKRCRKIQRSFNGFINCVKYATDIRISENVVPPPDQSNELATVQQPEPSCARQDSDNHRQVADEIDAEEQSGDEITYARHTVLSPELGSSERVDLDHNRISVHDFAKIESNSSSDNEPKASAGAQYAKNSGSDSNLSSPKPLKKRIRLDDPSLCDREASVLPSIELTPRRAKLRGKEASQWMESPYDPWEKKNELYEWDSDSHEAILKAGKKMPRDSTYCPTELSTDEDSASETDGPSIDKDCPVIADRVKQLRRRTVGINSLLKPTKSSVVQTRSKQDLTSSPCRVPEAESFQKLHDVGESQSRPSHRASVGVNLTKAPEKSENDGFLRRNIVQNGATASTKQQDNDTDGHTQRRQNLHVGGQVKTDHSSGSSSVSETCLSSTKLALPEVEVASENKSGGSQITPKSTSDAVNTTGNADRPKSGSQRKRSTAKVVKQAENKEKQPSQSSAALSASTWRCKAAANTINQAAGVLNSAAGAPPIWERSVARDFFIRNRYGSNAVFEAKERALIARLEAITRQPWRPSQTEKPPQPAPVPKYQTVKELAAELKEAARKRYKGTPLETPRTVQRFRQAENERKQMEAEQASKSQETGQNAENVPNQAKNPFKMNTKPSVDAHKLENTSPIAENSEAPSNVKRKKHERSEKKTTKTKNAAVEQSHLGATHAKICAAFDVSDTDDDLEICELEGDDNNEIAAKFTTKAPTTTRRKLFADRTKTTGDGSDFSLDDFDLDKDVNTAATRSTKAVKSEITTPQRQESKPIEQRQPRGSQPKSPKQKNADHDSKANKLKERGRALSGTSTQIPKTPDISASQKGPVPKAASTGKSRKRASSPPPVASQRPAKSAKNNSAVLPSHAPQKMSTENPGATAVKPIVISDDESDAVVTHSKRSCSKLKRRTSAITPPVKCGRKEKTPLPQYVDLTLDDGEPSTPLPKSTRKVGQNSIRKSGKERQKSQKT